MMDKDDLDIGLPKLQSKKYVLLEGSLIRNVGDKTEKVATLTVSPQEAQDIARRKNAPRCKRHCWKCWRWWAAAR